MSWKESVKLEECVIRKEDGVLGGSGVLYLEQRRCVKTEVEYAEVEYGKLFCVAFIWDCGTSAVLVNRGLPRITGGRAGLARTWGCLYISRQFINHLFT